MMLHLVCWNVAGWATTVDCINRRHGDVATWLAKNKIDILCLQEVKVTASRLAEQPKLAGVTPALLEKYDCFFSCCSAGTSRGFNGVATFARKGLTISADPQPFADHALDCEGRAIVTVHDGFAILNVYVPNDGAGSRRLPFKMRFLRAMEDCMQRLRNRGFKVLAVGDFNIGRRPEDISWDHRILNVSSFMRMELPEADASRDERFLSSLFSAPCCSHCGWHGCLCLHCSPSSSRPGTTSAPSTSSAAPRTSTSSINGRASLSAQTSTQPSSLSTPLPPTPTPTPTTQAAQASTALSDPASSADPSAFAGGTNDDTSSATSPVPPPSSPSPSPSPSRRGVRRHGLCRFCHVHLHDDEAKRERKRIKHMRAALRQARALQGVLREHWPVVTHALSQRVVEEQEVTLKRTSKQVKYRVRVRGVQGRVRLGQPCETRARAEHMYTFEKRVIKDDDGTGDAYLVRGADEMCIADIVECLDKIAGVSLADWQQRCLGMFALPISSPPCVQWLNTLLEKRGCVDVFTSCYPNAQARFTCHDQYKNRRYENKGSRIDYIVLDGDWKHRVVCSPADLITSPDCPNPFCAMCALSAVTLNGRWKPAPFDGTGMVAGRQEDYEAHITRPRTGVVYTPPQYSDHLAIAVVLDLPALAPQRLSGDKATRGAQPHTAIKRISSFFSKRAKRQATADGQGGRPGDDVDAPTHANTVDEGDDQAQQRITGAEPAPSTPSALLAPCTPAPAIATSATTISAPASATTTPVATTIPGARASLDASASVSYSNDTQSPSLSSSCSSSSTSSAMTKKAKVATGTKAVKSKKPAPAKRKSSSSKQQAKKSAPPGQRKISAFYKQ
ncbi:hypothetical protein PTSG_12954 [Salpingoeca rosetta]|uniref:Endonuclease/exonuclease/phosphatase domain-containing protein n=1 Tax=Salpingoeca rosetta (strain ATCC 50818 / BSB-021) TaxID=946362 RepID=F2UNJ6_SALR5|nr:uncharacterized protein PTSG_12954 [Salpingoeca rosetta]EGD79201.1 hypothetical protein PTSG_12954 [Salpingoeca rosetta]|eukprot:XP_004989286.1 hypothetical protein PTSG_12954 [Salpingoeca rosetta]